MPLIGLLVPATYLAIPSSHYNNVSRSKLMVTTGFLRQFWEVILIGLLGSIQIVEGYNKNTKPQISMGMGMLTNEKK